MRVRRTLMAASLATVPTIDCTAARGRGVPNRGRVPDTEQRLPCAINHPDFAAALVQAFRKVVA